LKIRLDLQAELPSGTDSYNFIYSRRPAGSPVSRKALICLNFGAARRKWTACSHAADVGPSWGCGKHA